MLISLKQLQESEERFDTANSVPNGSQYATLKAKSLLPSENSRIRQNIVGDKTNIALREQVIKQTSVEPHDFAFERAMGNNDSVYSNFIDLIQQAKGKVGRIIIKEMGRGVGYATGFMVSPKLLLTNWHVFKTKELAQNSEVQFNYEYDVHGNSTIPQIFKIDAETFYHSNEALDYCLVAVKDHDNTGHISLQSIGYLFLDPISGKIGDEQKEKLNIIHHPDGDYKQLSIRENRFIKITPVSIWYETDTARGSSGSPVFNDQWLVVGLHHSGKAKKNDKGQYLDKDDNVIPEIDGKINEDKIVWVANEGMRISVILDDIFRIFDKHPLIEQLKVHPEIPKIIHETKDSPYATSTTGTLDRQMINISLPVHAVQGESGINITMRSGGQIVSSDGTMNFHVDNDEIESKALEDAQDFTACKGYKPDFLGRKHKINLPDAKGAMKNKLATIGDTANTELKYHSYSVRYHKLRKMPLISAINVDGDPKKRLDNTERKDKWIRDKRLEFEDQLGGSYYSGSGFDKGHMSRREDANYGKTAEEAKRNADYTCVYTNACPQAPGLNRISKKGLWGNLEKAILESGVIKQSGKGARISVFNGPIFNDNDKIFNKVAIPTQFYKIVLWLTDDDTLRVTGFVLSQENELASMQADREQLDIDQNVKFQSYLKSIANIQTLTKIDFSELIPFDTFKKNRSGERKIDSELQIEEMLLEVKRS